MSRHTAPVLRTLGRPQLLVDGHAASLGERGGVAILLLAYVRLQPGAIDRSVLASLFWPDRGKAARASLRQAIHQINESLPGALDAEGPLNLRVDVACDLDRLRSAAPGSFDDAELVSLCVPFCDGVALAGCSSEFVDWVNVTREEARRLVLSHVRRRLETASAEGNWPAVSAIAQAAHRLDAPLSQHWLHVAAERPSSSRTPPASHAPALPSSPPKASRRFPWWVATLAAVSVAIAMWGIALLARSSSALPVCNAANAALTIQRHNYQLGTIMKPGQRFTKGWWLEVNGRCRWPDGFTLRFVADSGTRLSGNAATIAVPASAVHGSLVLAEVPMRAPTAEGAANERWALRDPAGKAVIIQADSAPLLATIQVMSSAPMCATGRPSSMLIGRSHDDDQPVVAGASTTLIWAIRNDGDCTWPANIALVRSGPGPLSGDANTVSADLHRLVGPGEGAVFRVRARIPERAGRYTEHWRLVVNEESVQVGGNDVVSIRLVSVPAKDWSAQDEGRVCQAGQVTAGWVNEAPLDSVSLAPGERFDKVWVVSNASECSWDRIRLAFRHTTGVRLSTVDEVRTNGIVRPRALYAFAVPMIAPTMPGIYQEVWALADVTGRPVFVSRTDSIWMIVRVRRR